MAGIQTTEGMKSEPLTTKPLKLATTMTIRESGSRSKMLMGSKQVRGTIRWNSHGQEILQTGGKVLYVRVEGGGG